MITLERVKTKTGRKWLAKNSHRLVRIFSAEWGCWWGVNRAGYTVELKHAGIYTLADAFNASGHCGLEKGIRYKFCEGTPTQEARGSAQLMLRAI